MVFYLLPCLLKLSISAFFCTGWYFTCNRNPYKTRAFLQEPYRDSVFSTWHHFYSQDQHGMKSPTMQHITRYFTDSIKILLTLSFWFSPKNFYHHCNNLHYFSLDKTFLIHNYYLKSWYLILSWINVLPLLIASYRISSLKNWFSQWN